MRAAVVPVTEAILASGPADYADAFEVVRDGPDHRTAEQWMRCGLEQSPRALRRTIVVVHRHVLRFRLGPLTSGEHVLGWRITEDRPDLVRLEATSPILRAAIVGRRIDPIRTRLTTLLWFERPTVARVVWAAVGPLHRRIAPYLLARAARGS